MDDTNVLIRQQIMDCTATLERMAAEQAAQLAQIANAVIRTLKSGGTLYFCGNGGSAADAQHIAAEFIGRYVRERRALPAVALTSNSSLLTAIANDYDYSQIFARQVRASLSSRDALVGISTSGKSANVLLALRAAHEIGALTIGVTGLTGDRLAAEADLCLRVPSTKTSRIQESYITAWHAICELVERAVADPE